MTTDQLLASPGRGNSGKIRNFKAMSDTKLAVVIAELEQFGDDPEALAAAYQVAGIDKKPTSQRAPEKQSANSSDNPLADVPPGKIAMKGESVDSVALAVRGHKSVIQPKFDGHRILIHRDGDGVAVWGRATDKTARVPLIAEQLAYLPAGTWLDGEIIAGEGHGKGDDWGVVQGVLGSSVNLDEDHHLACFVAFDILCYDGLDLRRLGYGDRFQILTDSLVPSANVTLVPSFPASQATHDKLVSRGFEGTMVKWLDAPYLCGRRGHGVWKIKMEWSEDVIVTGFEPGKGSFAGLIGALRFAQIRDGEIVDRGTASGMDMDGRRDMTHHPEKWVGTVVEVTHKGAMPSGSLRSPQFKRRRPDKDPLDCVWT